MEGQKPAWMRWGIVALAAVAAVLLGLWLKDVLVGDTPAKKPKLQQITLLKPPPPPPPEQKPPEPEMKQEEVKIEQPQPDDAPKQADNDAAPGKDLGVDADGSGAGDGFGLVGRKGGRDLLAGAGGRFGGFTTVLRQQIQEHLSREKKLRSAEYKVVVYIWLARDGRVEKTELNGSSGNADTDGAIRQALAAMPLIRETPPEDMPQPVKLRITSRT
jgi:protein TonB